MERAIAAIATPLGEGGIGVIRISGENAIKIASKIFKPVSENSLENANGYTAHFGHIEYDGEIIDEAIATVFKAPKSYTGEDVVEFSTHGGNLVLQKTLRALFSFDVSPADRGEFTKRAYMNGKLDLCEAESVINIISATSDQSLKASIAAKGGAITKKIGEIKDSLLYCASIIAAFSDYPDEEPEFSGIDKLEKLLISANDELSILLKNYDAGKVQREGVSAAIVGKPNVGKSTIMNLLSGIDRSIVTDVAGTTRDVIEETVRIGSVSVRLSDTAGIRETDDVVEKIGVDRSNKCLETADIVFAVFDVSEEMTQNDLEVLQSIENKRVIYILNKCDIENEKFKQSFEKYSPVVKLSAKSGNGKQDLVEAVEEIVGISNLDTNAVILSGERQRSCVEKTQSALTNAIDVLASGMTVDAVGVCLDDALKSLLELTGERVTNEVANEVFKRFCVGK